jgi:hypothetical protein
MMTIPTKTCVAALSHQQKRSRPLQLPLPLPLLV